MVPPKDVSLPFFAYGVFKPGELAFHRLNDLVASQEPRCSIKGDLRVRDGLPIAHPEGHGKLHGVLIRFRPGTEHEAYSRIAALEPKKQYRWDVASVGGVSANYLAGKSPMKGSVPFEGHEWSGKSDPLFTVALEVVEDTMKNQTKFQWLPGDQPDLRPLFRLEMAYLLLWSCIERYASLRYDLSKRATNKVLMIADEPAFRSALSIEVKTPRKLYRADDPSKDCVLDPSDPRKSIAYYHQVRNNLVHRGKAAVRDHEILDESLRELLAIFRQVLDAAFDSSALEKPQPQQ